MATFIVYSFLNKIYRKLKKFFKINKEEGDNENMIDEKMIYDGIEFDNNDQFNRYLLNKYLQQEYISNGATTTQAEQASQELIIAHKDSLFEYHGLAYILGSRNLEFFALYFLSSVFVGKDKSMIAPIHSTIWKEVQDTILDKSNTQQLEYLMPRGIGKSTFISLCTAIFCSVYKYKSYTVIASAIGDTASTFIRNIKLALDGNTRIEKAFGKLYDTKKCINNTEQIELTNRTMIQSISASSTLRGKSYGNTRIELLLLDDFQKDDEVATADQREKKWKKYNDDVKYAIQKGNSTIIAVGTVQHSECFYSRLSLLPTWKVRNERGVLVDDVDELFTNGLWLQFKTLLFNVKDEFRLETAKEFYFQHKSSMQYPLLWQSYWDCLDYALSYYENPSSFKQEVQGDTSSNGEKRFTTIIPETPKTIESHTFTRTMLAIDPASSTGKRSDYSAFIVGSLADTSIKYVRKGEILKLEFDDYISHILELLIAYKEINTIYIEKNLYMGTDILKLKEKIKDIPELSSRNFEWQNEMQRTNKTDKINTIVGDVNFGRIIFNSEDTEAIEQMKDYQGEKSLHDDFVDCVAEFSNRIISIKTIGKISIFNINF